MSRVEDAARPTAPLNVRGAAAVAKDGNVQEVELTTVSGAGWAGEPASSAAPAGPSKSKPVSASINFLNTIVGAGIIGIPYAISRTGFVFGVFSLLLTAGLTAKTVKTIVRLSIVTNTDTYASLCRYSLGSSGVKLVNIFTFLLAAGAMIAYFIIIGDTLPPILHMDRYLAILVFGFTIMYPLTMCRDVSMLVKTSFLSILSDVIICIIIMAHSPIEEKMRESGGFGEVVASSVIKPKTVFAGLSTILFAFVCHHSTFLIYNSLKDKSKWNCVTNASVWVAAALCAMLGISGYLGFLDETKGDVLNNFPEDDGVMQFARLLLAVTMVSRAQLIANWRRAGRLRWWYLSRF